MTNGCAATPGLVRPLSRTTAVVASLVVTVAGCADLGRSARTSATAGDPKPEAAPARSRTIDNTGFVDNGGRTSDQWARPTTSGARATEAGGHPPTGTNTGIPVGADLGGRAGPIEPMSPRAAIMPGAGGAPLADEAGSTSRLARARCDRETACGRVGGGQRWQSQSACMAELHGRTSDEVRQASCELERGAVATCLGAVRATACALPLERLDALPACSVRALCPL